MSDTRRSMIHGLAVRLDEVTGLPTVDCFRQIMEEKILTGLLNTSQTSIILFEADPTEDPGAGPVDQRLRGVAQAAKGSLRASDLLTRYRENGFAIVLPHTCIDGAGIVAERIRRSIGQPAPAETGPGATASPGCTASFGVASLVPGDSLDSLTGRAEKALSYAQKTGRNKIAMELHSRPRL